jgi:hypothetical protein
MPDALSRAPMEVQLPKDKVLAFDTANFWLTKIYPGMSVQDKAANRDQAMGMNAIMQQLSNDPAVQSHLKSVGRKDVVVPPGYEVVSWHYDSGSKSMVPLLRKISDSDKQQQATTSRAVRDAWSTYTKLQTAAKNAPLGQDEALRAKAAKALQYVLELDPVFAATIGAEGGAVPPASSTTSKVNRLNELIK